MPAPSATTFVRPDLRERFEEFDLRASRQGFIGLQALPMFGTGLQAANFSRITVESLLASRDTARESGGGYNRQEWEFEQDNFFTEEHGAEEKLDDREEAIYQYTVDFEMVNAERCVDAILRNQELRIAALLFNSGTFNGAAVTNEWDDRVNAVPIDDVKAGITAFKGQAGMLPNTLIISDEVMRNLTLSDQIIERIKYSGLDDPKRITPQMLAALFDVEQVLVPNGQQNSADQGQTITFADIWDDEFALLCRVARSNDLREPCIGRTFHFTGDGSSEGGTLEQYREERVRADIMRCRIDIHEKLLYTPMGYLLSNITS